MRPYMVLDAYCGAGGAAKGYADAGFEVIGVDNARQKNYPYPYVRTDALEFLKAMATHGFSGIDAIHASPPCQRWSVMSNCRPGLADEYPDLIEPTRFLLRRIGLPYVIENVPGAPLKDPVELCGCQFGLTAEFKGGGLYGLRRPRHFETWPFTVPEPGGHDHSLRAVPVYGNGAPGNRPDLRGRGLAKLARDAMGIDWMPRSELNEAIPPAFTKYVGKYLMDYLDNNLKAA